MHRSFPFQQQGYRSITTCMFAKATTLNASLISWKSTSTREIPAFFKASGTASEGATVNSTGACKISRAGRHQQSIREGVGSRVEKGRGGTEEEKMGGRRRTARPYNATRKSRPSWRVRDNQMLSTSDNNKGSLKRNKRPQEKPCPRPAVAAGAHSIRRHPPQSEPGRKSC